MTRRRDRSGSRGQALVEMLVVLPVLFLLLLAASDIGKLFVISGKSEIAARYIALSQFRQAPFGDAYPGQTEGQEIERLFFDDALDDNGLPSGLGSEPDDPDVTYEELGDEELDYAPVDLEDPLLRELWDFVNITDALLPIRGSRSSFAYDLPFFPYGREHPMEIPATPASSYDASGNFVMLADAFSGSQGDLIRTRLEIFLAGLGVYVSLPSWSAILVVLWAIFLP